MSLTYSVHMREAGRQTEIYTYIYIYHICIYIHVWYGMVYMYVWYQYVCIVQRLLNVVLSLPLTLSAFSELATDA